MSHGLNYIIETNKEHVIFIFLHVLIQVNVVSRKTKLKLLQFLTANKQAKKKKEPSS